MSPRPDIRADRAVHRMARSDAGVRARLARLIGVTDTEIMAILRIAEHGTLTATGLQASLGLSAGGATALVQRLERERLVRRTGGPSVSRAGVVALTPWADLALAAGYAALAETLVALAGRRRATLVRSIRSLVAAVEAAG